jgi:hypothetical protein
MPGSDPVAAAADPAPSRTTVAAAAAFAVNAFETVLLLALACELLAVACEPLCDGASDTDSSEERKAACMAATVASR